MRKKSSLIVTSLVGILLLSACFSTPREKIEEIIREEPQFEPKASKGELEKGEYIIKAVASCGRCHGANTLDPHSDLSGGSILQDSEGQVTSANITSDKQTGVGSWSVDQIKQAIRASIAPNGKVISKDVHLGYRWISDDDVSAMAKYLLNSKAVHNKFPRRELGFFEKNSYGIFSKYKVDEGYITSIPDKPNKHYGRYLVKSLANCESCHNAEEVAELSKLSARFSEAGIVKYLSKGSKKTSCPLPNYKLLRAKDKIAIAKYLKQL